MRTLLSANGIEVARGIGIAVRLSHSMTIAYPSPLKGTKLAVDCPFRGEGLHWEVFKRMAMVGLVSTEKITWTKYPFITLMLPGGFGE